MSESAVQYEWKRREAKREQRELKKAIAKGAAVACVVCGKMLPPRLARTDYQFVPGCGMQPTGRELCDSCYWARVEAERPMRTIWHVKGVVTKRHLRQRREAAWLTQTTSTVSRRQKRAAHRDAEVRRQQMRVKAKAEVAVTALTAFWPVKEADWASCYHLRNEAGRALYEYECALDAYEDAREAVYRQMEND